MQRLLAAPGRVPSYGWSVGATGGSTGYADQNFAKLSASAVVDLSLSPGIAQQCSYIGQFYAIANTIATAQAAAENGLTFAELKTVAVPVLEQVLSLVSALLPELVDDLTNAVQTALKSVGDQLGDSIPLIGAIIQGVIDIYLAIADEDERDASLHAEHCRDLYVPPAKGTGKGGAIYPCDLLAGSLGDLIDLSISRGRFEGGWFYGSDVDGKPWHRQLKSDSGIPAKERKLLLTMLWAIRNSRGHAEGDGGEGLWPIFIDLLYSQFQQGRIGFDGVYYRYCKIQLWRGPSPGWCCEHGSERRAFEQYKEIVRRWGLTIDPLYVQDRAKADQMRAALRAAEQSLLSGGDGKVRPKISIPHSLTAAEQSLLSGGDGKVRPKISIPHSLTAPPKSDAAKLALGGLVLGGLTKALGWW